ncbi:hypothetical protein HY988_01070 [Candidatus Micrarchaeota archaeon]|nr:hypothetical protein [Candidatus Micrarchaeota archaeon]
MALAATLRAKPGESQGSIGPTWPPALATCNRIKGIYPEIIQTGRDVQRFLDGAHAIQREHAGKHTRVHYRAFIERDERTRQGKHWDGLRVEGIRPVDNVVGEGIEMVDLGSNADSRRSTRHVFAEMLRTNFGQTIGRTRPDPASVLEYVGRQDYFLRKLDRMNASAEDLENLARLYVEALPVYMFTITPAILGKLLEDPETIFLVGMHENRRIVASMIAEHSVISVEGRPIHLYELSDFATSASVFGNHQGRKLMTALQIKAIRMIQERYGNSALVYAEDRAPHPAVVLSSFNAGLTPVGALELHVKIGGIKDPRFDEGVPGMETLIPVALIPEKKAVPPTEILELHGVKLAA